MGLLSRPLSTFAMISALSIQLGCVAIDLPDEVNELEGVLLVEWKEQDEFIYRKFNKNPLRFQPAFMDTAIVPKDMYTTGGSVPQILWGIPGLSPWALGPAYIIHDWIFDVHRCNRDAPEEIKNMTFPQSAQVLAEVGKSLVDAGLIKDNRLPEVVWAIKTRYAENIWNTPGTPEECKKPPAQEKSLRARERQGIQTIVFFEIPPRRR